MAAAVGLIDCNNFYASCERLFQPELRGKPVVVLSNNDGCVIARSNEAKALGIPMGEAWHLCRDRVDTKGVIVRSSNYSLYGDMSARVMRTLADHAPELEVYSIDEAFVGLAGFGSGLEGQARALRLTVQRCTGIPVSIGIAPTKTLAKVANRRAKKDPASDGVFAMLDENSANAELADLALTNLWGVGPRLAARLSKFGIKTPLDLKGVNARFIRERFSVTLERTVLELRGIPCLALEEETPNRKTVTVSRSFGRVVETLPELQEAIATFTARAAEKMRRQSLVTARLTVFAHTSRFCVEDEQYYAAQTVTLPGATADSGKLVAAASRALAVLFQPGYRYAKAGVLLLDLQAATAAQGSLFDLLDDAPATALMRAVDGLNRRYGRNTVTYAAAGTQRAWKLRSAFLSHATRPAGTNC